MQPAVAEREALLAAIAEQRRRKWLRDPILWCSERTGDFLWSKQREIFEAVRDYRRVAVQSCHDSGKSFIAARIAAWWIDVHPPGEAFVVTSAPTGDQVKAILWREMGRVFAKGKLAGRINQTEWLMTMPAGNEEIVAFGRKPSDLNPTAFQGIHAPYVLVIFDEACGIFKSLWEAGDSLISNEESHFLAIGNPDDPVTEFAEVCKPNSGWHNIRISAFDTPNFTGEDVPPFVRRVLVSQTWVAEKEKKWGVTNPMYIAKVLGKFPESTTDGLIPLKWIRDAQARWSDPLTTDKGPNELGCDVGGGGDKNVIAHRQGMRLHIHSRDQNPDTMQTAANIQAALVETGASVAKVDIVGIGRGAVDRCKEQNKPVVGINVGSQPTDPEQYLNLRMEGYWHLRELFQTAQIALDPGDEDLAAQLADLHYRRSSQGGKLVMESKEEMKRRGKTSPDEADAAMLACLPVPSEEPQFVSATWGY